MTLRTAHPALSLCLSNTTNEARRYRDVASVGLFGYAFTYCLNSSAGSLSEKM